MLHNSRRNQKDLRLQPKQANLQPSLQVSVTLRGAISHIFPCGKGRKSGHGAQQSGCRLRLLLSLRLWKLSLPMCRLAAKRWISALAQREVWRFLSQWRSCKELRLPPLDPEQRKQAQLAVSLAKRVGDKPVRQAKKLAEKYPEIKCESYGFGEERALAATRTDDEVLSCPRASQGRLHLFKSSASLKAGLAKEGQRVCLLHCLACSKNVSWPSMAAHGCDGRFEGRGESGVCFGSVNSRFRHVR